MFQVIQEIDDMMQETPSSEGDLIEYNEALEKGKEVLNSPLYEDSKLSFLQASINVYLSHKDNYVPTNGLEARDASSKNFAP